MKLAGVAAPLALLCASNAPPPSEATPPEAHVILSGPGTELFNGWPPERYLRETRARILLTTVERVQELCDGLFTKPLPRGFEYDGCHRGGTIITFLPARGDGEHFARIVAHEIAHHHGWGKDHPQ